MHRRAWRQRLHHLTLQRAKLSDARLRVLASEELARKLRVHALVGGLGWKQLREQLAKPVVLGVKAEEVEPLEAPRLDQVRDDESIENLRRWISAGAVWAPVRHEDEGCVVAALGENADAGARTADTFLLSTE